jgi:Holliday junction DNA helicase RuvA
MISSLVGTVFNAGPSFVVIRCNGVGYGVHITPHTSATLQEGYEGGLYVHTHVYDGGIDLYGFVTPEDKDIFLLLTKVKGLGHKKALSVVSGLEREPLIEAIKDGNIDALCKIPRVGKRTAERLVVELREKLGGEKSAPGKSSPPSSLEQARAALVGLGYKAKDVKQIMPSMCGEGSVTDQIVEGLKLLQGG